MAVKGEEFVGATRFSEDDVRGTKKPEKMVDNEWEVFEVKAVSTIQLCLSDEVMYCNHGERISCRNLDRLESWHISKSLTNKLYFKQKLYEFKMIKGVRSQKLALFGDLKCDQNTLKYFGLKKLGFLFEVL